MSEEDHSSLPDGGLEQSELGLHGPPLLRAKGGGGGQHQQDDMGLWLAEGHASAQILGHPVWSGAAGQPPWGVHHCYLIDQMK